MSVIAHSAGTHHERAAEALLEDCLRHPGMAPRLMEAKDRLRAGTRWERDYVDAIGRDHFGAWPLHQVSAFASVHAGLSAGMYGSVLISAGGKPQPDRERNANARTLMDVHEPFVAHLDLDQNHADSDGRLSWDEEVMLDCATGASFYEPAGHVRAVAIRRSIGPGSVPLEVGSTLPSRTLLHLLHDGGVARWPYRSEFIHLFVDLRRWNFEPGWLHAA